MTPGEPRSIAILHYSAPPIIGGVENVILAHLPLFMEAGFTATVVAGRGEKEALPLGAEFIRIPKMDSQHPEILEMSHELELGRVPSNFEEAVGQLANMLTPALQRADVLIVHNVFTKHFNLPLTAALFRLLDQGTVRHCIAWCHDLTWTSPNSRSKVYPAYPWDLLRTRRSDITYVTVSQERQHEMAGLFMCSPEEIQVIYNGVDPGELLALSEEGLALINRLDLWESDLNLLLPVRVTQAKNIEFALHLVASLKRKGIRPKLVVTGPPDPHDKMNMEYFRSLLRLRRQLDVIHEMHFVFESGSVATEPLIVTMQVVSELFRVSDALLMPSHREGFGMPILEAGLIGIPVFCADTIPAANEIGGPDVVRFAPDADPDQVAELILKWTENSPVFNLRKRVRQTLTWRSIFKRDIVPLMNRGKY